MWSSAMIPVASAQSCPEAEVVFARGQDEPAGMGMIGDAFVSVLRDRTGKQIGSYAVNYPAANADIAPGVADMTGHIQSMVANCPDIRLVVGGYSLGGGVTNEVLVNRLPPERTNTLRLSSRSGMPVGWWVHRCRRVPDIPAGHTTYAILATPSVRVAIKCFHTFSSSTSLGGARPSISPRAGCSVVRH
jgi:Cutinase